MGRAKGSEEGPLFPRLHVLEADKDRSGPRAPPRNKMALFEQFTVPSHRIAPSVLSNPPQQFVPKDNRYAYHPRYLPSPVAYSAFNGGFLHSVVGNSGSSTEDESQRVPGTQMVTKPVVGIPVISNTSSIQKTPSSKKSKDNGDSRVPTFSAKGGASLLNARKAQSSHRVSMSDKTVSSDVTNPPTNTQNQWETLARTKENLTIQSSVDACNSEVGLNANVSVDQVASQGCSSQQVGPHIKKGLFPTETSVASHSRSATEPPSETGAESLSQYHMNGKFNTIKEAETKSSEPEMRESAILKDCECMGDSENLRVSELSHVEECSDNSDSSMLDLVSSKITPKDLLKTFGQQRFWKAHQSIMKQQKIFSDQVFELHKLIEVQHLLAATPDVLLEEELFKKDASPVMETTTTAINTASEENKTSEKDEDEGHIFGQGIQSGGGCYPGLFGNNETQAPPSHDYHHKQVYMGGSHSAVAQASGNVWGYPCPPTPMYHHHQQWLGSTHQYLALGVPTTLPTPQGIYSRHNQSSVCSNPESASANVVKENGSVVGNEEMPILTSNSHNNKSKNKNKNKNNNNKNKNKKPGSTSFQLQWMKHFAVSQSLSKPPPPEKAGEGSNSEECETDDWAKSWDLGGAYHSNSPPHPSDKYNSCLVERELKRQKGQHEEEGYIEEEEEEEEEGGGNALALFPLAPSLGKHKQRNDVRVIRVVPRAASNASKSTAGILWSLQQERHH